ncbi:MAG: hypothetical protein AAF236_03625 [Verrucomicrobiota bacterium]
MKKICLSVCLIFLPLLAPAEEPLLEEAAVTLPYSELKALLTEALKNTEPEDEVSPPVESLLESVEYELDLASSQPTLTLRGKARVFVEGWQAIPLIGGDIRLINSTPLPGATFLSKEERFHLMTESAGEFAINATFAIPPVSHWDRGNGFSLKSSEATSEILIANGLPPSTALKIDGLTPRASDDGTIRYLLPGSGEDFRIYLDENPVVEAPPALEESSWSLHRQVAIHFGDGRLRYQARIDAEAETGSGHQLALALPANASRISINGEDLEDWKLGPRRDDTRLATIRWRTRDQLDRTLEVNWEVPQSALADTWSLDLPSAVQPDTDAASNGEAESIITQDSRTLLAILPVEGLELRHPDLSDEIDTRRLPQWLREAVGGSSCLTAEYRGDEPLTLAAAWLPRLETAQATIDEARFETEVVADGSTLVMIDYLVKHTSPMTWAITIPASDQILMCEINSAAASPIKRENGVVEFRLANPTPISLFPESDSEDPESDHHVIGSHVHLCYSLRTTAMDRVSGRLDLELPETDLFIHQLNWLVTLPDRYVPTAVEGNVELSTGSHQNNQEHLIKLMKQLCHDERPSVEIYYHRKDIES